MFTDVIMGPLHAKGVRSVEEYYRLQREIIARNRQNRPTMPWRDPWVSDARQTVYIGASKWVLRCACGDCAVVDPEAAIALCCWCGAQYADLSLPANRQVIEAILLCRPDPRTRNWAEPETVADLLAENVAHGDRVPS